MSEVIKSGSSGNTAEVTDANALKVDAVSESRSVAAAINGDEFIITTSIPFITLTSANKSSLLWASNLGDLPWVITRASFSLAKSASGTGEVVVEVLKNPTAGTLVDSGVITQARNLNFGSARVLASDIRIGNEGSTLTNGVVASAILIPQDSSRTILTGEAIILPPGSQLGLSITPPVGNASMKIHISVILHRVEL